MMPFKSQLALDLAKVKIDSLRWPMWVSQKIDGVWCCTMRLNESIVTFSRTGEIFTSMYHIERELDKILQEGEGIIFEAHAGSHAIPQAVVSGWLRDTKQNHPELKAACHTLIGDNHATLPYSMCWQELRRRIVGGLVDRSVATFVMQQEVHSIEEAKQYADIVIQSGGEGAVLRNPNAVYQPGKRNKDIIKVKKGVSFDLKVIWLYEGKGKYAGTLGGLTCRWKDGTTIDISGMTDAQRLEWWCNPSLIIGKVVQVDAMCESSKGKLREPRFKGIRYDKTEGDY